MQCCSIRRAFAAGLLLLAAAPAAAQEAGRPEGTGIRSGPAQRGKAFTYSLDGSTGAAAGQAAPPGAQSPPTTGAGQAGPPPDPQPRRDLPPFAGPNYHILREEEDWSYLRDPSRRRDWLDPLKYIPLTADGNSYLTLGADVRFMYELFHNENWGGAPVVNNDYLLHRYMVHADARFGTRLRGFVRLKSGMIAGREGGRRPVIDENRLDFNQAWLDVNLHVDEQKRPDVTLRVGRQEMHFGGGRLVSVREGINIRAGFDGLRLITRRGGWRVDTFATKPVFTRDGVFDDRPDSTQAFWGSYATGTLPAQVPFKLDAYYLGLRRGQALSALGIAEEKRHTVGGRIWKSGMPFAPGEGWDYDVEGAYQFGSYGPGGGFAGPFARGSVRAWTLSTTTGYTWDRAPLKPRIGVGTGIASGDKDPRDPDVQTFFTPFPNGYYFGAIQQNGPLNIQGVRPSLTVFLPNRMMIVGDTFLFWRQNVNDALYGIPGFPVRPAGPSRARYIGTQSDVEVSYPLTQHVLLNVIYAQFLVGRYLEESPPGKNLRYFHLMLNYQF